MIRQRATEEAECLEAECLEFMGDVAAASPRFILVQTYTPLLKSRSGAAPKSDLLLGAIYF